MRFIFNVEYNSVPGEDLLVEFKQKKQEEFTYLPLAFVDHQHWQGVLEIEKKILSNKFSYQILVSNNGEILPHNNVGSGTINLKKIKGDDVIIDIKGKIHCINSNFANTKPFKILNKRSLKNIENVCSLKKATHIFSVNYPQLQQHKYLCITGSAEKMNYFDGSRPIIFKHGKDGKGIISLNLAKENFPIEYKIGIYDDELKSIVEYENGNNHIINSPLISDAKTFIQHQYNCDKYLWKGAGINIPVFSIRTSSGWGTGDFKDVQVMVDYASSVGIKLLQLLPVNDTTSTLYDKDSYPYSAISSFALHPKLLSVQNLADSFSIEILPEEKVEIQKLNSLSFCDHAGVMKLKFAVLERIFLSQKNKFLKDKSFIKFFNKNTHWLVPYAAFCTLRDKNNTLHFDRWENISVYDADKVVSFSTPNSENYETILYWYFVQYHLHEQLLRASKYAKKNGIILKADLPIGVGRYSVDTWVNPHLFHMDMQAGAPPDAFSSTGQNWNFPTYNIGVMAQDNFGWFKKRMQHLQTYFDAVRIDHVLGLFRIWSIPVTERDGRMGIFVPAIPVSKEQLQNAGLAVDYNRYCLPYNNEDQLKQLFGDDFDEIKTVFFDSDLHFKTDVNTQIKLAEYLHHHPKYLKYEQEFFTLLSNVILLRDALNMNAFHFRINMEETFSFKNLSEDQQSILRIMYSKYFFHSQNELWKVEGISRLKTLKKSTDMLLCAEDLGMVPDFMETVLQSLEVLSLQVQQMPKNNTSILSDTVDAKYNAVVMPSTHDMPTVRLWWENNKELVQLFYNTILHENGGAPYFCEPWICKKITENHLNSSAMLSIFLLQDLLAIDGNVRRPNPAEERINDPANPDNVWNYRMHISVEELQNQKEFNDHLKGLIKQSGR